MSSRYGLTFLRRVSNKKATYSLFDSGKKGPYQFRMMKEGGDRFDTFTDASPDKFHQTMDSIEAGGKQAKWQDKDHSHQVIKQGSVEYKREAKVTGAFEGAQKNAGRTIYDSGQ